MLIELATLISLRFYLLIGYGGRNARIGREFVLQRKSVEILEKELLNGQKSQGPETAAEVNDIWFKGFIKI